MRVKSLFLLFLILSCVSNANIVYPPGSGGGGSASSNYAQAFVVNGNTWSSTSTVFFPITHGAGTATLTIRNSSGITLTAAPSSAPGIVWTPLTSSSVYEVTATFSDVGDANFHYYRFSDGTNVFGSSVPAPANQAYTSIVLTGIYVPGTASAVTLQIQGAVTSGGTVTIGSTNPTLGSSIEWTVKQIK
jgi:hypothetical protein